MVASQALIQKLYLLLPLALQNHYQLGNTPAATSSAPWSYEDTNWGTDYPQCNGNRQSPIHIQTSAVYPSPIRSLKFVNYDTPLTGPLVLSNNGHSVEFEIPETTNGQRPYITGSTLKGKYEAVGVHFHWGSESSRGSEHVIDNRRFDVEMHIVHKKVTYATVDEATQHSDGLAVLGIMFEGTSNIDRYYPGLNKIFDKLADVELYPSTIPLDGQISLGQMLGDLNTRNFFTYQGSLTTPGCAEAVTWHVFPEPLPISQQHIEKFWSIIDSHDLPLIDNYRPVQELNGRPVFQRISWKQL